MKKKVSVLLAVITVIVTQIWALSPKQVTVAELEYIVRPQDTLWSIMTRNVSNEYDVREYIHLTSERNSIQNGHITPGQKLVLVIPK